MLEFHFIFAQQKPPFPLPPLPPQKMEEGGEKRGFFKKTFCSPPFFPIFSHFSLVFLFTHTYTHRRFTRREGGGGGKRKLVAGLYLFNWQKKKKEKKKPNFEYINYVNSELLVKQMFFPLSPSFPALTEESFGGRTKTFYVEIILRRAYVTLSMMRLMIHTNKTHNGA